MFALILQGTVFSLEETEDPGVIIAEDSNDIYILSGEQASDQLSPPASLLTLGDSSGPTSWQTESLPVSLTGHESWAQIGIMDPEDVKSLDSAEGVATAEEQSENNSSNSDIVHVEREDAELLEEGGEAVEEAELQSSILSVLGSESELAAVREEVPLVSIEQPNVVSEVSDDPVPVEKENPAHHAAPVSSFLVPELQSQPDPLPAPVEPQSMSLNKDLLSDIVPPPYLEPEPLQATLEKEALPGVEQKTTSPAQEPPVQKQSPESCDLPVLLYGGAALVAIVAVLACGVLAYRKK